MFKMKIFVKWIYIYVDFVVVKDKVKFILFIRFLIIRIYIRYIVIFIVGWILFDEGKNKENFLNYYFVFFSL